MYKTGHAFSYLLLKESVANDVINVSLFAGLVSVANHAIDKWRRRPVSTLKADILNITYDCYSQINNVEMAALHFDNWRWLSVLFCCERKWTKNNSVLTEKCCFYKFTK